MDTKQEIILRAICAFEQNGYAHFILSNLSSVAKPESFKQSFKELEMMGYIKDVTTNGYAKKVKIIKKLDCPDFIFFENLNMHLKKYLMVCYKEWQSSGKCISYNSTWENALNSLGLTREYVKISKTIKKKIESKYTLEYTDYGYKIINYTPTKEYCCSECGTTDSKEFYGKSKSLCKKCALSKQRNKKTSLEQKLLKRSKDNANRLGLSHDLDIEFIHLLLETQNNKCKYSGITFEDSFANKYTYPTIDRKDSSKGYTKDNVCLCTWYVNIMKNNASIAEFKQTIKAIHKNINNF